MLILTTGQLILKTLESIEARLDGNATANTAYIEESLSDIKKMLEKII